jgi:hypothetical protein
MCSMAVTTRFSPTEKSFTQMSSPEIRYSDLLAALSHELGVVVYPQKLSYWCEKLHISGENGWYDSEDWVALKSLGVAFTRHKYRGKKATDFVVSQVEQWRLTQNG